MLLRTTATLIVTIAALSVSGCMVGSRLQSSQGSITVTNSHPATLPRVRVALEQFSAKYDYKVSPGLRASPELEQTEYTPRSALFNRSKAPHATERPSQISACRGPAGSVIITYRGRSDVLANTNPIVNDLKKMIRAQLRGEKVAYR